MKIAIGNDHTALEMKNEMKKFLEEKGYEVIDYGTNSTESCDYPVYGEKVGNAVAGGEADLGLAICGTGVGISLACNKVYGKAFQNAQRLQRPRLWRQSHRRGDGKNDYGRMAECQIRRRKAPETRGSGDGYRET